MKQKKREVEITMSCKVSRGMFSSERGVHVRLPDGREVSALVDKRHVIVERDPRPGSEVSGRVKVDVVKVGKDSVIVDLPQPGIAAGPRLKVPKSFLRSSE